MQNIKRGIQDPGNLIKLAMLKSDAYDYYILDKFKPTTSSKIKGYEEENC